MEQKYCTSCGAPLTGVFCGRCGTKPAVAAATVSPVRRKKFPVVAGILMSIALTVRLIPFAANPSFRGFLLLNAVAGMLVGIILGRRYGNIILGAGIILFGVSSNYGLYLGMYFGASVVAEVLGIIFQLARMFTLAAVGVTYFVGKPVMRRIRIPLCIAALALEGLLNIVECAWMISLGMHGAGVVSMFANFLFLTASIYVALLAHKE